MTQSPDSPPPPGGIVLAANGGGWSASFRGKSPRLEDNVLAAPGTWIIGDVHLGKGASVWFGSVLRGDINRIEIGEGTNIQDLSILHVADDHPCIVGRRCVVGHRVTLHGCQVADETMIGMGATLLNGVVVGSRSLIAAGALLPEGMVVPSNSLVMGAPAKIVKSVTPEQIATTKHLAEKYQRVAREYLDALAGGREPKP